MHKLTIEENNLTIKENKRQTEAQKLPHGKERDALPRKARQLETASHTDRWLSSPGLKPVNTHEVHEGRMVPKPVK